MSVCFRRLCSTTLFGAVLAAGCAKAPSQPKTAEAVPSGVPVRVAAAASGRVVGSVALNGDLKAAARIELAPKISARVTRVAVREGDPVKAGDLLVSQDTIDLDSRRDTAQAAVRQARASLASARAALESASARLAQSRTQLALQEAGGAASEADAEQQLRAAEAQLAIAKTPQRSQEMAVAESAVAQAEANFEKAAVDRKRYAQLFADGAASRSQLDQAATAERVAKSALDSAKAQWELSRIGGRDESIRQAEAAKRRAELGLQLAKTNRRQDDLRRDDVRTAEAAYAQAKAGVLQAQANLQSAYASLKQAVQDIRNSAILAPVDGVVSERRAEIGQLIGPGTPVLVLETSTALHIEASVPELEIGRLREGSGARIEVDALPGQSFSGVVSRLYPSVGTDGSFRARIEMAGSPKGLKPGMFCRIRIDFPPRVSVLVDKDALAKSDDGRDIVYVVSGGKGRMRSVRLGRVDDRTAEVLEGVQEGEQVVVAGQTSLTDGSDVNVVSSADGKK